MNFRKIKISYLFNKSNKQTPKIILSGEWLKNAGFEIGNSVKIEVKQNQIIIKNEH